MSRSSGVAGVQESRTERDRQYGARDWDVVFRVRDLEPDVYVPKGTPDAHLTSVSALRRDLRLFMPKSAA
jgi:hypothetical protein